MITLPVSFVQQYTKNLQMLCQQKGSKLRGLVSVEQVKGDARILNRLVLLKLPNQLLVIRRQELLTIPTLLLLMSLIHVVVWICQTSVWLI